MEITKLTKCEYLIAGSTIPAMCAALERSRRGRVLLVTEDTCLYSEMTRSGDYRRPVLSGGDWERTLFPEDCLESDGLFHPDRLKRRGEQVMREHGVSLLYACQVLGRTDGGVILAHKSGLYAVECREALDFRTLPEIRDPAFCLHSVKDGENYVTYVPVSSAGNGPRERFDRYEAALGRLPEGHAPARSGTEVTGLSGVVPGAPEEQPVPPVESGDEAPACENPLYAESEKAVVPGLRAECDAWDVVVVGGGTSGASAAICCARLGLRTMVLEMNRQLGGTATAGGVSMYWFGWRGGATRMIDERVDAYYRRLGIPRGEWYWTKDDSFLPDLKAQALLGLCLEAGVQVRFSAVVCGVKKDAGRVSGVYWAGDGKLHCSAARMVLDCTGDGDVCVFAGAEHVYGNEMDGMTFWASLAQFDTAQSYRNNFSTMVHVGDPLDYTRFILAGRLRGEGMYDHGSYVAVRESRHIRGLETVTLEDILSMRKWEDTLYSCFSNYDPKGRLTSGLVYFGLQPPHQRIDIPRGAVIPVEKRTGRAIGGLLVGGKAVSCTHDALPGIRMQPDLQRQGLALAALAFETLSQDVPAFLAEHVEETIRKLGGDLMRADRPEPEDLAGIVASLRGDEAWEWLEEPIRGWQDRPAPVTRVLLADRGEALPLLRDAFSRAETPELRLLLARLLLWHGDDTGAQCAVDALRAELDGAEGLPRRRASLKFCDLLPDHGCMPEAVYLMNALAGAKSIPLVPVFEPVLDRLEAFGRDWTDPGSGIYCYCESFALAAARSGDRAFVPLLHRILDLPELRGKASLEILEERFCMLRIALYSALNGLGDPRGREGLEEYLNDDRRPLALAAGMLLGKTGAEPRDR